MNSPNHRRNITVVCYLVTLLFRDLNQTITRGPLFYLKVLHVHVGCYIQRACGVYCTTSMLIESAVCKTMHLSIQSRKQQTLPIGSLKKINALKIFRTCQPQISRVSLSNTLSHRLGYTFVKWLGWYDWATCISANKLT